MRGWLSSPKANPNAYKCCVSAISVQRFLARLLDDVTDDLPAEACEALEDFLTAEPPIFRVILIASRDRTFMDKVCNKVIAIHAGGTKVLNGSYTKAYLAGGDFLHFRRFSLWQPKSSGLRATQAACAFASLVSRSLGQEPLTLVDVGTGTGLLTLILAQEFELTSGSLTNLEIYALDIDETAMRIATANFEASPWVAKLKPIQSSVECWQPGQAVLPKTSTVFVCNPPYDDEIVNARIGTEKEQLSRKRALERGFLPLDVLFTAADSVGCQILWILWGNAEAARLQQTSCLLSVQQVTP